MRWGNVRQGAAPRVFLANPPTTGARVPQKSLPNSSVEKNHRGNRVPLQLERYELPEMLGMRTLATLSLRSQQSFWPTSVT
jgi:hypothetical protein